MKKNLKTILTAAAVLFASCQNEQMVSDSSSDQTTHASDYVATTESYDAQTKTSLDSEGNVLWKTGDQLTVFDGNTTNRKFQVTDDSNGKTSANLDLIPEDGYIAGVELPANIAYYPYSSTNEIRKNGETSYDVLVTLPATQTYAQNSFGNGSFPMVAVTTGTSDKNLTFKNVLGGLKLQLKGTVAIRSISVTGNNDEILYGAATVTASNGEVPTIVLSEESATTVTLDCGVSGVLLNAETATNFVISLPPMTMEGGFTINITDTDGGTQQITTTKSQTITRSRLLKMPEVTVETVSGNSSTGAVAEYNCDIIRIDFGYETNMTTLTESDLEGIIDFPLENIQITGYDYDQDDYVDIYMLLGEYHSDGYLYIWLEDAVECFEDIKISFRNPVDDPKVALRYTGQNYPESIDQDWVDAGNYVLDFDGVEPTYSPSVFCTPRMSIPPVVISTSLETNVGMLDPIENRSISVTFNKNIWVGSTGRFAKAFLSRDNDAPIYFDVFDYEESTHTITFQLPETTPTLHGDYDLNVWAAPSEWAEYSKNVIQVSYSFAGVTIDKHTLSIDNRSSEALSTTVSVASNSISNPVLEWSSSNPEVAVVDENGVVTGIGVGTTTITVKAILGGYGFTDECMVTVTSDANGYDYVDLGLSVKWATVNVGATKPEEYGDYFAWGATEPLYEAGYAQEDPQAHWKAGKTAGYTLVNTPYQTANPTDYFSTKWTKYLGSTDSQYKDGSATDANALKTVLDLEDDAAHVNWGGDWRMPTIDELDELCNTENCTWTWTTLNGVNGYKVQSKKSGYTDKWIFLPATGVRNYSYLHAVGSSGYYWSSSLNTDNPYSAYDLYFYSSNVVWASFDRDNGRSVRPILP